MNDRYGSSFQAREDQPDPQLVALLRATLAHRGDLLVLDPWLPLPQNCCCFSFGREERLLPIHAAFFLWDCWLPFTGPCPKCGGRGYGIGCGGFFNSGGVSACCIDCGHRLFRYVGGGLSTLRASVQPLFLGSPYQIATFTFGGAVAGAGRPLVAALRGLGVTDLPDSAWVQRHDWAAVQRDKMLLRTPPGVQLSPLSLLPSATSSPARMPRRRALLLTQGFWGSTALLAGLSCVGGGLAAVVHSHVARAVMLLLIGHVLSWLAVVIVTWCNDWLQAFCVTGLVIWVVAFCVAS